MLVLALDLVQFQGEHGVLVTGLLDEPAHLATAALALLALLPSGASAGRRRFVIAALLASVLIDVDHVPLYLGAPHIEDGGRPFSHSLVTVAALLGLWAVAGRRGWLSGAALGVLLHFSRDVATGPGLELLWPLSPVDVKVSYLAYVVCLCLLALGGTHRALRLQRPR